MALVPDSVPHARLLGGCLELLLRPTQTPGPARESAGVWGPRPRIPAPGRAHAGPVGASASACLGSHVLPLVRTRGQEPLLGTPLPGWLRVPTGSSPRPRAASRTWREQRLGGARRGRAAEARGQRAASGHTRPPASRPACALRPSVPWAPGATAVRSVPAAAWSSRGTPCRRGGGRQRHPRGRQSLFP